MESEDLVVVKNLKKRFQTTDALSNISLTVKRGEIYGIIGRSGAGKSTLIHCLTGLQSLTEGSVTIAGLEISSLTKKALCSARKKIGMVFQHFSLFASRTALENVLYPLEIDGRRCEKRGRELLRLVGLEKSADLYPSQLSGGQKQRVAIARALAASPEVLLCDEPSSALDPETTSSLLELLAKLNQELGLTILLITHEMGVIKKICTHVAVLDEGTIVEEGSVLNLFARPKHPTTRRFLQNIVHDIPDHLFLKRENTELLRLCFIEGLAEKAVISQLAKTFPVDVNILLGAIDMLQEGRIGSLLIELSGQSEDRERARAFLEELKVIVEVVS